jgi:hypothetical protein
MRGKFAGALGAYVVLAALAVWLLTEPKLRAAVLVLLVALAINLNREIQNQQANRNGGSGRAVVRKAQKRPLRRDYPRQAWKF